VAPDIRSDLSPRQLKSAPGLVDTSPVSAVPSSRKVSGQGGLAVIYLAYHPAPEDLEYVRTLSNRIGVVVVSNSGDHDFGSDVAGSYISDVNIGVGAGYNAGLATARGLGFTHVLFHDQDSRLDLATVPSALSTLKRIDPAGCGAVLSLTPVDLATQRARTARVTHPVERDGLLQYQDVQFSGLVAPVAVFADDSPFSDYLFVDFVDTEWCWRVSPTVRIMRDPSLTIGHRLGSGTRSLLGQEFTLPQPKRFFYQTRNLVVLAGVPYAPSRWPLQTTVKFGLRAALLPFVDRRGFLGCWKQIVLGVRVGMADRKRFVDRAIMTA
jgi:rhamnosyltransferase